MRKILAFLVLATFLPALVSAQEIDPYDDEYWDDWVWEDEGFVVTEAAPPRRLQDGSVAVEVISAEEIQNTTAVTLVDVLTDFGLVLGDTGHHAGEQSGERIVMQGVDGGNVIILINGRRVPGRQGDNLIAATLPLSNVERIEVTRGAQSVRHGTAAGGVINIITREPDDRVTFSMTFHNRLLLPHDDPDTDVTPVDTFDPAREQNFTAVVGFPIGRSRNVVDVEASRGSFHFDERGVRSILPRYSRGRLGFDSIVPLSDDIDLNFGISGMMLRSEHQTIHPATIGTGASIQPNPIYGQPNHINRRDYARFDAHAGINWFLSDEIELAFDVSNSYYHRQFDRFRHVGSTEGLGVPAGRWRDETVDAWENHTTANVVGEWLFRPTIRFTGGIEGQWQVAEHERFPGDTVYWQNYELFVEVEHFVSGRYSVTLGVRAMYNPRFDPMAVPRLSGAVHLGGGFRLLAGVGMGYRVPNLVNLYSILSPDVLNVGYGGQALGDPNLRPETSLGTNLGLEWTGTRAFIHLNAFHTELWNQIDNPAVSWVNHPYRYIWVDQGLNPPGATFRRMRNLDRSFRSGFDAEGRANLPLYTFVTLGYSYVFAWDRNAGEEMVRSPPHAIRGRVGIDLPVGLSANANFRWTSSFTPFSGPTHTISIDPDTGLETATAAIPVDRESTFVIGLFAAYRVNENWRVTAAAENITRATNTIGERMPTTFSMGVGFTM
ncbi:MAG: TonB-dependent receptor [Treponema sp.]|nr:TonB-dependent receptor [Treponema sp.]